MSVLKLENAQAFLRKISINVLSQDSENTLFTLPCEGIALSREQLNAYMGPRTFESWFDKRKDGTWVPMDWVLRLPEGSIALDEKFETDGCEIVVTGKKELVFEPQEPEEDDEEGEPAARITQIVLTPKVGGVVLLAFHLQVRPGLGKENLALQQHQYRHITITLGNVEEIKRKAKQQDLDLNPKDSPSESRESRPN